MPDGRVLIGQVLIGKKELPRTAVHQVLSDLEIPLDDFLRALR